LLLPLDGLEALGIEGKGFEGFTVAVLSVLELVTELKRELGSFLVIVHRAQGSATASLLIECMMPIKPDH